MLFLTLLAGLRTANAAGAVVIVEHRVIAGTSSGKLTVFLEDDLHCDSHKCKGY